MAISDTPNPRTDRLRSKTVRRLVSTTGALTLGVMAVSGPALAKGGGGATAAPAPTIIQLLAKPFSPELADPAVLAKLGSPASPEEDLTDAIDALATAPDAASATAARQRALDILEGNPIAGKSYSGIPLLNWNLPEKVKTVPAGGTVSITEVRAGDAVLSDTWLLKFQDPTKPFSIDYHLADLTQSTAELSPATVMSDGSGTEVAFSSTDIPDFPTGTSTTNRTNPVTPVGEETRRAIQLKTVAMPAPQTLGFVLDANRATGHEGMATLRPATAENLAAAEKIAGFASGTTPTRAQEDAAIANIGPSPEKVLWEDVHALDPNALDLAHTLGQQDHLLVSAMRDHSRLPAGVASDPAADVAVVLVNDETYVSKRTAFLAPGAAMKISVTNADLYNHSFMASDLHARTRTFGVVDWGKFSAHDLAATPAMLTPGQMATYSVMPSADAFALWLGDPMGGDQASTYVNLTRDVRHQSVALPSFGIAGAGAFAGNGDLWVPLQGSDTISRITPAADLSAAKRSDFALPGGVHALADTVSPLSPHQVAIDGHGIVWASLVDGNGVARIDPAAASPGGTAGISRIDLPACGTGAVCNDIGTFPPAVNPLTASRRPTGIAATSDAAGNTILWLTEQAANAVAVLKVSPAGAVLGQAELACGCDQPSAIAVGSDGSAWFTAINSNELVQLPASADPLAPRAMNHVKLPSSASFPTPLDQNLTTADPIGLAIDHVGRVWVAEAATGKLAFLTPGSTVMTELNVPANAFGRAASPGSLAVDKDDTVFFADAIGDEVGAATTAGVTRTWKAADRVSNLTGAALDGKGNLWVTETRAAEVTRFMSVGVMPPAPPAPAPTAGAPAAPASAPAAAPAAKATAAPAAAKPASSPAPAKVEAAVTAKAPAAAAAPSSAPAAAPKAAPAAKSGSNSSAPVLASDGQTLVTAPAEANSGPTGWQRALIFLSPLFLIVAVDKLVFGPARKKNK